MQTEIMHMGTNARIISKVLTKYRNTFYALKELINNSIMAKSTRIEISLIPKGTEEMFQYRPVNEIIVKDNGIGVPYSEFYKSIMEVATDNKADGLGIGRFGGLQIGKKMTIETVAYDGVCDAFTKTAVSISLDDFQGDDLSNKEFVVKREILTKATNSYYKVHISDLYHYDLDCPLKNKLVNDFVSVKDFSNKLFQHYPLYIFDEKVTFFVNGRELKRLDFVVDTPQCKTLEYTDTEGKTHSVIFYYYSLNLEDNKVRLFLQVNSGSIDTTALELTYNTIWYSPIMGAQYVIIQSDYITKDLCDNFILADFREKEWDNFAAFIKESIDQHYKEGDLKYNSFLEQLASDKHYPFNDVEKKNSPLFVDVFNKSAFYIEEDLKLVQNNSADKKLIYALLKKVIESGDVRFLVENVLGLSKSSQKKLTELLDRSSLDDIVAFSSKVSQKLSTIDLLYQATITDQAKCIEALKNIDVIVSRNLWIIGEEYSNSIASIKDIAAQEQLDKLFHTYVLNKPSKKSNNLIDSCKKSLKSVDDLVLYNERQTGNGNREILAINFRRPSCCFNQIDLTNVDSYIYAIQSQPQFVKMNTYYKLFFVVYEMSDYVRSKVNVSRGKYAPFLYQEINDGDTHIQAYIVQWNELIGYNRRELSCMSETLRLRQEDAQALFLTEYSGLLERRRKGYLTFVGDGR